MELMAFTIASALVVAALSLAWFQSRRTKFAEQEFTRAVRELPSKVLEATRVAVRLARSGFGEPWVGAVDFCDVNNDGERELLVQYPAGAHGSALHILEWKDRGFREVASLGTDTPGGFDFGDFDGDGKMEIRTEETDWSSGLPYVEAPRFVTLFRWNGKTFMPLSKGNR